MSPRRRTKLLWRYVAGEHGHTYTVEERYPGSVLYERVWDPEKGEQVRQSLGHRNKEEAVRHADACAELLKSGARKSRPMPASAGNVLRLYLTHRTPEKTSARVRDEDVRRAAMWVNVLGGGEVKVTEGDTRVVTVTGIGADRLVSTIGAAEFTQFVAGRTAGAIDATGKRVPRRDQVKVGPRTVEADLVFLNSVFNWALSWNNPDGTKLLRANPWGSAVPGVKRSLQMPKNDAPNRPIASYDRFLQLRAAAPKVMMQARRGDPEAVRVEKGMSHYGKRRSPGPVVVWQKPSFLPEILDIIEDTGRRRGAVLQLQYSDLRWGTVTETKRGRAIERRGIVAIRWRPFKRSKETVVPVSTRSRAVLESLVRARPGVGDLPLWPSIQNPQRHISEKAADEWLIEAHRIAGVPRLKGGLWHPFRRKFATERKHLPDVDVMYVAGWNDVETMKSSYQQADSLTITEVLEEPRRLREQA